MLVTKLAFSSLLFVFATGFGAIAQSQTDVQVFTCTNSQNRQTMQFSVRKSLAGDLSATLKGTSSSLPVTFETTTPSSIFDYPGVTEVANAAIKSRSEWSTVTAIEVYTVGNFEDDAAGVRGVNFLKADGSLVAAGMFFGWAGALKCD